MDNEIKLNFWVHAVVFGFILAACGIYGLGFAPVEMVGDNAGTFMVLFLVGAWTMIIGCVASLAIIKKL